ncbi:MAG: hypothetical protein AAF629_31525 [Chloroflexota bacterium]
MESPSSFFDNGRDKQKRKARIRKRIQDKGIADQIARLVEDSFNSALSAENAPLSRMERQALFNDILEDILADMLIDLANP